MTILVSPADKADKPAWETLYKGYATFYKMPMSQQTLDTVWTWIHDDANPFWCRLARQADGSPIGLMHFREMPSPLRGCLMGFLDDLFVDLAARGHGAVNALFDDLADHARARDWPSVRWITADDNYRARAVYDRLSKKTQWNTYQLDIEA
jgi:ribosomal protein S18 acetylase RimI-like enzyme